MSRAFLRLAKEVLILLLGSIGYAVGIALFLEPKGLAAGGVSGLAIVLSHLTGINTGIIIFTINIPILIIGIYKFGIKFFLSTIFVITMSSVVVDLCEYLPIPPLDTLCAGVVGAVLVGGAIGVLFRVGATTGGSDIIVRLLRLKWKHTRTGGIFLALDFLVIGFAGIVFRNIEICVYAVFCVFIEAYIINFILYGMNSSELAIIVSENETLAQEIRGRINVEILPINQTTFMTAVPKSLTPRLREAVCGEDKNALMIVAPTKEIFGNNFSPFDGDEV